MKQIWLFLMLCCVIQQIISGPLRSKQIVRELKCARSCHPSKNFDYAKGHTYRFTYSTNATIAMGGASKDNPQLSIKSDVRIDVLGRCEMVLRLQNSHLEISNERGVLKKAKRDHLTQFDQALRKSPLRFSFKDGQIEHMCLESWTEDPPWVLNFKKGILSALQTGLTQWQDDETTTENDISGECKTQYSILQNGDHTISVRKTKSIMGCRKRQQSGSSLFSVPYEIDSEIQSMPIMNVSYDCKQTLGKDGILHRTDCVESHFLRPLSQGRKAVSVTVRQSLVYTKHRKERRKYKARIKIRQPLTFDFSENEVKSKRARFKVERILRELCQSTEGDVRPETPQMFHVLVSKMRLLNRIDLSRVHHLLQTNDLCSTNTITLELFLDALPAVASRAALRLMTSLLTSGHVTGARAKMWLTSLAFISAPTSSMLKEIQSLLHHESTRLGALLPVSALIHNFCRHHGQCSRHQGVADLVTLIEEGVGSSCDLRGKNKEEVLLSLRALGNAGFVGRAVSLINDCMTNASYPLSLRVAAAHSFRRMPCQDQRRNDRYLWEVFKSSKNDPELRVTAYLSIVRCANSILVSDIAKYLHKMAAQADPNEDKVEPDKVEGQSDVEVISFVTSHLRNMQNSANPHKQSLKQTIKSVNLSTIVTEDLLNMSKNYEYSAMLKKLNAGLTAEGNVLWSGQHSPLPRSLTTNLTVELFGDSLNLLDIGWRMEGFEKHLKSAEEAYQHGKFLHWLKKRTDKDVEGHVFARVFGNEILYLRLPEIVEMVSGWTSTSVPSRPKDVWNWLSGRHDYSLTRAVQFVDTRMTLPTISGLPIHLTLNGEAAVDLRLKGNLDLWKGISKSRSPKIDGECKASGAVEIVAGLSLDASVTKVGLSMRSRVHTSAAINGRVQVEKGHNLKVHVDAPKDTMKIFEASIKAFAIHGNKEKQIHESLKRQRPNKQFCTGNNMATVSGLELCAEFKSPAQAQSDYSHVLLNGPMEIGVTLHKTDRQTGYKFSSKLTHSKPTKSHWIVFDTPGSKVNRTITLHSKLNTETKGATATLILPWKQTKLKATLVKKRGHYGVTGRIKMNRGDLYAATADLKVSTTAYHTKLRPKIKLHMPDREQIGLEGEATVYGELSSPRSAQVNLSLSGLFRSPTILKAKLTNKDTERSAVFSVKHIGQIYNVQCTNKMSNFPRKGLSIHTSLDASTPSTRWIHLVNSFKLKKFELLMLRTHIEVHKLLTKTSFNVHLARNVKTYRSHYKADIWLRSRQLAGKLTCDLQTSARKLVTSTLALSYSIPKYTKNNIQLTTKIQNKSKREFMKYSITSTLNVKYNPDYDLDLSLDLGLKKRQDDFDLQIRYGNDPGDLSKKLRVSAMVKKHIRSVRKMALSYSINAIMPPLDLDARISGKHHHSAKTLDSSITLHHDYKRTAISASLENQSKRLRKYKGRFGLSWEGNDYVLNTEYNKITSKNLMHVVTLKNHGAILLDVKTNVDTPKFKTKKIKSEIFRAGVGLVTLESSALLTGRKFEFTGIAKNATISYGFAMNGTYSRKYTTAKMFSQLFYPGRKIVLAMNGSKRPGKIGGRLDLNISADSKACGRKCLISFQADFKNKSKEGISKYWAEVKLQTPLAEAEKVGGYLKLISDRSSNIVNSSVYWGTGRRKSLMAYLKVNQPLVWESIQAYLKMQTPLENYRHIESEISHKLSPEMVTLVKSVFGLINENTGSHSDNLLLGQDQVRDFKISTTFNSNLRSYAKTLAFEVDHYDAEGKIKSLWKFDHDKQAYHCGVRADLVAPNGLRYVQNFGTVMVSTPENVISASWDHKNTFTDSKSSLQSSWNDEKLMVTVIGKLGGLDKSESSLKSLNTSMIVESTWEHVKNVTVFMNHKQQPGIFQNRIDIKDRVQLLRGDEEGQDPKKSLALSILSASWGNASADMNYTLETTLRDHPIEAEADLSFPSLPYTGNAFLAWSPVDKVSAQGTIRSAAWNDLDLELNLASPLQEFSESLLKVRNLKNKDKGILTLFTSATLNYDFDKEISLLSNISARSDWSCIDVSLQSPFDWCENVTISSSYKGTDPSDIEASFQVTDNEKFKVSADLDLDSNSIENFRLSSRVERRADNKWHLDSNVTIENKVSHGNIETNALVRLKGTAVKLSNKLISENQSHIAYTLVLETPIEEYNSIGIDLLCNIDDENFTSKAAMTCGSNVEFQGNLERRTAGQMKAFKSSWQLSSPVTETIVCDIDLVKNQDGVEFKYVMETPFERIGDFQAHGAIFVRPESLYNLTADLRLPAASVKQAKLQLHLDSLKRKILSSVDVAVDSSKMISDLNVTYGPHLEASLLIDTGVGKMQGLTRYSRESFTKKKSSSPPTSPSSSLFGLIPRWLDFTPTPMSKPTANPFSDKHKVLMWLDLDHGYVYKLTSTLDLLHTPMKFVVELDTPIEDLRHVEVKMSHKGTKVKDFRTTAVLILPTCGLVSAYAKSDILALTDFSAEIRLMAEKLLPPGVNNWILLVRNSRKPEGMQCQGRLQWTKGQQISMDAALKTDYTWYNTSRHLAINVSTPFENIRVTTVRAELCHDASYFSQKINTIKVAVTQDQAVDLDLEYHNTGNRSLSVKVRRPLDLYVIGNISKKLDDDSSVYTIFWGSPIPLAEAQRVEGKLAADLSGKIPVEIIVNVTDSGNQTLTFSSRLMNTTAENICCNYSVAVILTRPANDLDLRTLAHLLLTPHELEGAADLTYLATGGDVRSIVSRGKLRFLERDLNMSIITEQSGLQLFAAASRGVAVNKIIQRPVERKLLMSFPRLNLTQLLQSDTSPKTGISEEIWAFFDDFGREMSDAGNNLLKVEL